MSFVLGRKVGALGTGRNYVPNIQNRGIGYNTDKEPVIPMVPLWEIYRNNEKIFLIPGK